MNPLVEVIAEPVHSVIEKSDKTINLKATAIADYARYDISTKSVYFSPTLMYTSRVFKLSLKNTSAIAFKYSCKLVSAENGLIDPGYFSVSPHEGTVSPACDEQFVVKFLPTEVYDDNERLLVIQVENLAPDAEKLIVELNGEAERPICHFELAPTSYREKKPDLEAKYSVVDFESLGTRVRNTKRFFAVNPTAMAYEFEWKKEEDLSG